MIFFKKYAVRCYGSPLSIVKLGCPGGQPAPFCAVAGDRGSAGAQRQDPLTAHTLDTHAYTHSHSPTGHTRRSCGLT